MRMIMIIMINTFYSYIIYKRLLIMLYTLVSKVMLFYIYFYVDMMYEVGDKV